MRGTSGKIVLKTPSTLTAKSFLVAATMSAVVPEVSSVTPAFAITRSIGVESEEPFASGWNEVSRAQ